MTAHQRFAVRCEGIRIRVLERDCAESQSQQGQFQMVIGETWVVSKIGHSGAPIASPGGAARILYKGESGAIQTTERDQG